MLTARVFACALTLALALSGFAASSGATTYYVDHAAGSDEASGVAPAEAWKHYPGDPRAGGRPAECKLAPGDTVCFKGGVVYRGSLQIHGSGTSDRPVTWDGNSSGTFGEGRAVIDGSEPVTGWRRCTSADECGGNPDYEHIWTASVPHAEGMNALTAGLVQDGRMLFPAQYPNPADPFWGDDRQSFLDAASATPTSITDPRFEAAGGAALVGGYAFVDVSGNDLRFVPITEYDAADHTIRFGDLRRDVTGRYALANSLSERVFDRPGEYVFVDEPGDDGRHRVYVRPWDGADPREARMAIAVRPLGVSIAEGDHHVTVRGFAIRNFHTAIRLRRSNGIRIVGNEISHIRRAGYANAVNASRVEDYLFADNDVHDNPRMRTAVTHTGSNVVYRNNRVHRGGRTPLVFYRITGGKIVGNRITDCTGVHSNGISVYVDCADVLVARNEVRNSNIGLTIQNSERVSVIGNLFTRDRGAAIGLWPGKPHVGHVFLNNTVVTADRAFYLNTPAIRDCVFRNNILSGFDGVGMPEDNTVSHNLYLKRVPELGEGEFIVTEPGAVFRDRAGGDFRLVPTGPAVDMGADVSGLYPTGTFPETDFAVDLAGRPRPFGPRMDLGAYEAEYPEGALADREPIPTGEAARPETRRVEMTRRADGEPIVLEATEFSGQGGGEVGILDPATYATEDLVRYWNDAGHWLEWTVEVPHAGRYTLSLRYTTQFDTDRKVSVNGRDVEGLEAVTMQATGGWKHWRVKELPAEISLAAGENRIRLTSLGGHGCNLDGLRLTDDRGTDIRITAGDFTAQGGGEVEVVPSPRPGLIYGWNDEGHWLEWTAVVPEAGRYEMVLRYATKALSPRKVSVNGQVVDGLEYILPEQTDDWRRCRDLSMPVPVQLEKGKNTLRITSLGGGGLNVDEIRLYPLEYRE